MRHKTRGYILVQVLIVVACLVALMTLLVAQQRAAMQATQNKLRERRAELAARSALSRALAVLADAKPDLLTQQDDWWQLGDSGNEEFTVGETAFRVQIIDAGSRLSINQATEAQLQKLPLTPEQIACLLDWREPGMQPRTDGAKDAYYNGMTQPYYPRRGPIPMLSELLLIKGWTAETLYTPDTTTSTNITLPVGENGQALPLIAMLTANSGSPNTQAAGGARINLNQRTIAPATLQRLNLGQALTTQIVARAPITSFRQLFGLQGVTTASARRLLDSVTFSTARTEGKINLNTASRAVLETLPDVTSDVADKIVGQQASGFQSLGQITTLTGIALPVLARIADACTVGSDTFIVRAYGEANGVTTALEATIRITNNRPQVLNWERINTSGIPTWWGWNEQATQTVAMENGQ